MSFPCEAYAARVGLTALPRPDEAGLFALHHAQFYTIPFENLDIQLGRELDLTPSGLFSKLLERSRGGYCFELNGLMLLALQHLGFEARPVLARVHLHTPPSGRTHQINAVTLGGKTWLVDVGFGGGGPRQPMLLEDGWEARDRFWGYRIERREPWGWLMSSFEGDWRESYSFDLGHVTAQDVAVGNYYTSHSPDSHFTRMRVVSLPTPDGRVSLRDQELTRVVDGTPDVTAVPEGDSTLDLLRREFGIELDARFEDFRAVGSS